MATVFKSLVEAGTNGEITVQTFPNGQLGKDNDVVAQVKSGVIQSGIHSVGGFASIYPMIGVIDVPFVFPNISATYAVFDGPFGQKLAADIEAKTGLKVLGFGDSGGFFHFTNSKRPITSPEDMKGLKIRTMGLDTHKAVVTALGGQPAVIAWAEVYTALQTGVADGQMNPVPDHLVCQVQRGAEIPHLERTPVRALRVGHEQGILRRPHARLKKCVIERRVKSGIVAGRGVSRAIEASDSGMAGLSKDMKVNALTAEQLCQVPRRHHAGSQEDHRREARRRRRGHDEGLPRGGRGGVQVTENGSQKHGGAPAGAPFILRVSKNGAPGRQPRRAVFGEAQHTDPYVSTPKRPRNAGSRPGAPFFMVRRDGCAPAR